MFRVRFWLNNEPCGLICGCITYLLIFFGQFGTTRYVVLPWLGFSVLGCVNILLFNAISVIAMVSHFKAMTTDPGAVPKAAKPTPDDEIEIEYEATDRWTGKDAGNPHRKFCKKCRAFKPIRAHHCSICGRCIIKMDHHCPWVNNCVGIGNHKLFLLFIFWIFVVCAYCLVLIIGKYVSCSLGRWDCNSHSHSHSHSSGDSSTESDKANLFTILLIVESALFGIFTLCMMADQSNVLLTNQTQIDRLKNTPAHDVPKNVAAFNEVFGCPADASCNWRWLTPVAAHFPEHCREAIFGYRLLCADTVTSASASGSGSAEGDNDTAVEGDRDRDLETGDGTTDKNRYGGSKSIIAGVAADVRAHQHHRDTGKGRDKDKDKDRDIEMGHIHHMDRDKGGDRDQEMPGTPSKDKDDHDADHDPADDSMSSMETNPLLNGNGATTATSATSSHNTSALAALFPVTRRAKSN